MTEIRELYKNAVESLTASGQLFEMERCDINGVNYSVYKNLPLNMREYFEMMTGDAENAGKTFLVYADQCYTFAETMMAAVQFSVALVEDFGVVKGDRVAIAMRNNPEWIFAYIGAMSIGAVVVPMNAWWTSDELRYGLEDCGARVVVCDPQRSNRILPFADELDLSLVVVSDSGLTEKEIRFDDVLAAHQGAAMPAVAIAPEDDATIMYTSGSTGHPKGAVSTHRGIISALGSWGLMGIARSQAEAELNPPVDGDGEAQVEDVQPAALLTIPLFHVTGSHSIFLGSIFEGRKLVMMYKWDVEAAMQLIESERITFFNGVPTMSAELQAAALEGRYDLSSLLHISSGGAARPPEQVKKLTETFNDAEHTTGYGLTETNALGFVNMGADYQLKPASVGPVVPAVTEVKIVDTEGNTLGANERGEVCFKSPANVRGYWNRPDATAKAFVDGWFHTGDAGILDEEGFLFIVDRIKEIIIRGGENISCLEVEAAIYEHPSVEETVVFGLPDERLGEVVAAVIVVDAQKEFSKESLETFLSKSLAKFKLPKHIWFRQDKLPRIASGKISKREVKEEYGALSLASGYP